MASITPEVLRRLLRYEPETGDLFWLPRPREAFKTDHEFGRWNTRYSGARALYAVSSSGNCQGKVLGHQILAHRAAWAIYYGRWPKRFLDHINGNRSDNRIGNLREATGSENNQNRSASSYGASGHIGVSWHSRDKRWRAYIAAAGQTRHLGYFSTKEEAAAAYLDAKKRLHSFSPVPR